MFHGITYRYALLKKNLSILLYVKLVPYYCLCLIEIFADRRTWLLFARNTTIFLNTIISLLVHCCVTMLYIIALIISYICIFVYVCMYVKLCCIATLLRCPPVRHHGYKVHPPCNSCILAAWPAWPAARKPNANLKRQPISDHMHLLFQCFKRVEFSQTQKVAATMIPVVLIVAHFYLALPSSVLQQQNSSNI